MVHYLALLGLFVATSASAQVAPSAPEAVEPSRVFTARDVYALAQAGDPQISSDGSIAYTRATGGHHA